MKNVITFKILIMKLIKQVKFQINKQVKKLNFKIKLLILYRINSKNKVKISSDNKIIF